MYLLLLLVVVVVVVVVVVSNICKYVVYKSPLRSSGNLKQCFQWIIPEMLDTLSVVENQIVHSTEVTNGEARAFPNGYW